MAFNPIAGGLLNAVAGQGEMAQKRMETADKENSTKRMLDMEMEAKSDYEARVHERTRGEQLQDYTRNRGDSLTDYEREKADKIAAEERAYGREKGLIGLRRDPNESKLTALKLKQAEEEMKLPPAVKGQFDAYGKSAATIESAIYKAQAEGSFDPNSEQGKLLVDKLDAIQAKQEALLRPYIPASAGAGRGETGGADVASGGAGKDRPTVEQIHAAASREIANGADPARINKMLAERGLPPLESSTSRVDESGRGQPQPKTVSAAYQQQAAKISADLDSAKRNLAELQSVGRGDSQAGQMMNAQIKQLEQALARVSTQQGGAR